MEKDKRVTFRLTSEMLAKLRKSASKSGVKISEEIIYHLEKAMKGIRP
jgi:predicted DNA binding CopG/RHH family protein